MTTELPSLHDVVAEHLTRMREEGRLNVRPEPRCRVCRDPQVRRLVNELLTAKQLSGAIGPRLTYRDILAALEPVNRARGPGTRSPTARCGCTAAVTSTCMCGSWRSRSTATSSSAARAGRRSRSIFEALRVARRPETKVE